MLSSAVGNSTVTVTRIGLWSSWPVKPRLEPDGRSRASLAFRAPCLGKALVRLIVDVNCLLDIHFVANDRSLGSYSKSDSQFVKGSGVRWVGDFGGAQTTRHLNISICYYAFDMLSTPSTTHYTLIRSVCWTELKRGEIRS